MFSLLNKVAFSVGFVFFIFMIQSSTSSPLENDKLAQLTERLDRMQNKMEAENTKLIEQLSRMQNKMDNEKAQSIERLNRMQTKMDAENEKWTRKFGDLEAENEKLKIHKLQQDEELQQLKSQISHPKLALSSPKRDDGPSSRVLTSPPTTCQELKSQSGKIWPMNGIHLLKRQNKIKVAFCTFPADGSPVSENLIGQVHVETQTVNFYVQKNSKFAVPNAVIPFELVRLNEGNAFNLKSGIFTVPVAGIYHFDFSAAKDTSYNFLYISLQVNGDNVGRAFAEHFATGKYDTVSLSTSLRLAAGDRVNLFNNGGGLHDDSMHYTHFTGWLVEEDLM